MATNTAARTVSAMLAWRTKRRNGPLCASSSPIGRDLHGEEPEASEEECVCPSALERRVELDPAPRSADAPAEGDDPEARRREEASGLAAEVEREERERPSPRSSPRLAGQRVPGEPGDGPERGGDERQHSQQEVERDGDRPPRPDRQERLVPRFTGVPRGPLDAALGELSREGGDGGQDDAPRDVDRDDPGRPVPQHGPVRQLVGRVGDEAESGAPPGRGLRTLRVEDRPGHDRRDVEGVEERRRGPEGLRPHQRSQGGDVEAARDDTQPRQVEDEHRRGGRESRGRDGREGTDGRSRGHGSLPTLQRRAALFGLRDHTAGSGQPVSRAILGGGGERRDAVPGGLAWREGAVAALPRLRPPVVPAGSRFGFLRSRPASRARPRPGGVEKGGGGERHGGRDGVRHAPRRDGRHAPGARRPDAGARPGGVRCAAAARRRRRPRGRAPRPSGLSADGSRGRPDRRRGDERRGGARGLPPRRRDRPRAPVASAAPGVARDRARRIPLDLLGDPGAGDAGAARAGARGPPPRLSPHGRAPGPLLRVDARR